MRFVKKVNERGTVTLPAEIREVLGVEDGDIVEFEVLGVARKAKPAASKDASASPAPSGGNPE